MVGTEVAMFCADTPSRKRFMKTISVVIPTWKRVDHLQKVLTSLSHQTRLPDEVICGVREEDQQTRAYLAAKENDWPWPLCVARVTGRGVVGSMQAGADLSRGDLVCLFDDDAEPLLDWIELAEETFRQMPDLGILGGRDLLQDHPGPRRREKTTAHVGIITRFGRVYGNHHRGHGGPRDVDILKGCNLAMRGELIREAGFEQVLRGNGAQVHWEMALCADIQAMGYRVVYDPALQVIHHIAPRHGNDSIHRGYFDEQGFRDMTFNEAYVMISRDLPHRFARACWNFIVGSTICPGYLRFILKRDLDWTEFRKRRQIAEQAHEEAEAETRRSGRAKVDVPAMIMQG